MQTTPDTTALDTALAAEIVARLTRIEEKIELMDGRVIETRAHVHGFKDLLERFKPLLERAERKYGRKTRFDRGTQA